jgi:glycosyltransferase involved in cell wall biosynthesis
MVTQVECDPEQCAFLPCSVSEQRSRAMPTRKLKRHSWTNRAETRFIQWDVTKGQVRSCCHDRNTAVASRTGTFRIQAYDGVGEVSRERICDDLAEILNSQNASFFRSLVERDQLAASLDPTGEHAVVVYIGRIAVEKNVQALVDAVEHLDESWHAVIIGPQYVPLERIGPRVHLLPAQRRIGNWLGIADVLCHPSDYESPCFTINEAWLAGVPVVSCDYLVNRLFEERHGPMMWLVPIRPDPGRLVAAIGEAYEGRGDGRVGHAREVASREYAAPVMGKRWSDLVATSVTS